MICLREISNNKLNTFLLQIEILVTSATSQIRQLVHERDLAAQDDLAASMLTHVVKHPQAVVNLPLVISRLKGSIDVATIAAVHKHETSVSQADVATKELEDSSSGVQPPEVRDVIGSLTTTRLESAALVDKFKAACAVMTTRAGNATDAGELQTMKVDLGKMTKELNLAPGRKQFDVAVKTAKLMVVDIGKRARQTQHAPADIASVPPLHAICMALDQHAFSSSRTTSIYEAKAGLRMATATPKDGELDKATSKLPFIKKGVRALDGYLGRGSASGVDYIAAPPSQRKLNNC